ncbi:MAG: adenosylmethionine--8-amino-7-oxononanoate transaminase [Chitinophagaceae bacterium]|nr:MAG: adenosylmethionine--8-amino-7-oxononanoate transaminase [Chitinophagaceae bacterium]
MNRNLSSRDREVIWHPYTPQKSMPDPIPVVRGQGAWLYSENGEKYLDCISSWWVTIHGHAHPYIAEKIYKQALELEQVIFAGFTHEPAVELAERLLKVLPGNYSRIFYSDNGSTAVEVAIKMAIQYWWNKGQKHRRKIFAFKDAYHGDTFGAMSVSGRSVFTAAFDQYLFEVIFLEIPQASGIEKNKELITKHADEAACFIYEPLLQGSGGMNMYSAELMTDLLLHAQANNIICISDEVLTGFGRTGKLFAGENIDVKSDIICLSKGLTGGTMAMGVTACTNEIYEAFLSEDKKQTFFHGHSFTANPISCAAALASLDLVLKPECSDAREMINERHHGFAEALKKDLPPGTVENIRILGTIIAFELSTTDKNYLNQSGRSFTMEAMKHSVFMRPLGNTLYLMPPYCITSDELTLAYDTVLKILKQQA